MTVLAICYPPLWSFYKRCEKSSYNVAGRFLLYKWGQCTVPQAALIVLMLQESFEDGLQEGQMSSLIDGEGLIYRSSSILERSSEVNLAEVTTEWQAQIKAFRVAAG